MKETERREVVRRIQSDITERNELKTQYEYLEKLSKNPIVVKYLNLLEEIKLKEEHQHSFDSEEKMIDLEFVWAFESRIKGQDMEPCKHEIWLYDGSYYLEADWRCEHDHYYHAEDENHKDFAYNRYVCLECGKKIETKDWQTFENSHLVLKIQDDEPNLRASRYRQLYYQLLYENNVETARQKVIEQFNKDKEDKQKALKKKMES